ncbi:MAG: lasso peptide biosynthesis PqqD family chaperone [Frankia sp.]|nr:lasso peptide biosynthesis PqqD family chaperone [Frankia sp.]
MLTLRRAVVSTETDYGAALLDERSGRYWALNPTGALVLRELLAGAGPDGAAQALVQEYDVSLTDARADVDRLVTELIDADLLTESAGEPQARASGGDTTADERAEGGRRR